MHSGVWLTIKEEICICQGKIRFFSPIPSDQPHLFANASISCNPLFITDIVTGIHLENLTKLSPSYALHYTGDHMFALALLRDLEETVHKHITT